MLFQSCTEDVAMLDLAYVVVSICDQQINQQYWILDIFILLSISSVSFISIHSLISYLTPSLYLNDNDRFFAIRLPLFNALLDFVDPSFSQFLKHQSIVPEYYFMNWYRKEQNNSSIRVQTFTLSSLSLTDSYCFLDLLLPLVSSFLQTTPSLSISTPFSSSADYLRWIHPSYFIVCYCLAFLESQKSHIEQVFLFSAFDRPIEIIWWNYALYNLFE